MIVHLIILSRQQRTAIALYFLSLSFLLLSQKNPSVSDWLWAALSVSAPCSVAQSWLWCREDLLCGWLREPSGIWTWYRYSSDAAALSPFFQLKTRSRWPMHHTSLPVWVPHSYYIVDSMFLCLSSQLPLSALRLCVAALVSKWMFWNVRWTKCLQSGSSGQFCLMD